MDVLVVGHREVARLLPMPECIDVMEDALAALARGEATMPLRQMTPLPGIDGLVITMPSHLPALGAAVKVLSVFPGNTGTAIDSHQGVVVLFETDRGRILQIADAGAITGIRTAAVSGVATRALAREGASTLGILGAGTQAATHLEAVRAVRPIEHVRVWNRTPERARAFAERESARHEIPVEPAATARDAVRDADVVCTVTGAQEPVLLGDWVAPGTHVNAVGWAGPKARELDTQLVLRCRLYVDRRESALSEAGDVMIPIGEGAIGEEHVVGELGEVLTGAVPGRGSDDEVTVFESLGLAVEDLAAAHHIYLAAERTGGGTRVQLGGPTG